MPPDPPWTTNGALLIDQVDTTIVPVVDPVVGTMPLWQSVIVNKGLNCAGDQIGVQFVSGTTAATRNTVFSNNGLTNQMYSPMVDWYYCTVTFGADVTIVQQNLRADPNVLDAELISLGDLNDVPTDFYYVRNVPNSPSVSYQWNLKNVIGMEPAWTRTKGRTDIWIAQLDSGIDGTHVELQPKIAVNPYTSAYVAFSEVPTETVSPPYPPNSPQWEDINGHGSFVAGILGAQTSFSGSGSGIAGVSPNSPIVPIKVLASAAVTPAAASTMLTSGLNDLLATVLNSTGAPDYLKNRVRVVNMSLGNYLPTPDVLAAIQKCTDAGILVVGTTGNRPATTNKNRSWPGAFWNVMKVAATSRQDTWAWYSMSGFNGGTGNGIGSGTAPPGAYASVAAPGGVYQFENGTFTNLWEQMFSTWKGGNYANNKDGTSYSAPQVAGLAADLLALYPTMTWYDLRNRMEDTAHGISGSTYDYLTGWGRIDAAAATTNYSGTLTAHTFPAARQMVSMPAWTTSPDVDYASPANDTQNLLALNGASASTTKVYWWDPARGRYIYYAATGVPRLGPGRCCFADMSTEPGAQPNPYTVAATSRTYPGAYPFVNPNHPISIHLKPGWNMIGTPGLGNIAWNTTSTTGIKIRYCDTNFSSTNPTAGMAYDIRLDQAITAGMIDSRLFTYSTSGPSIGTYVLSTQLQPYVGYWVLVNNTNLNTDIELILPNS